MILDAGKIKYVCSSTYELKCEGRSRKAYIFYFRKYSITSQIPITIFKNERRFTK